MRKPGAERDNIGVTPLARWNPNSFLEPIVNGNPYFARLVDDLRSTEFGGGAGLAGWAFVKESLLDKTQPWPLIPGQDDTQIVPLIKELKSRNSTVRMLVNQFLQFESPDFDDTTAALAVLWALFASTFPLAAFRIMTTDPAGFGVLMGAMAVATFLIDTPLTLDVLRAIGESSKSIVEDLQPVDPDLIRWSPYPATTADNRFSRARCSSPTSRSTTSFTSGFITRNSSSARRLETSTSAILAASTSTAIVPTRRCIARCFRITTCKRGSRDRRSPT
jgi:hypothetical protein